MTDMQVSGNKNPDEYPHRFFSFLKLIVKQSYFLDDDNGKMFVLNLINNIKQKADAYRETAFLYKTKYKNILSIIIYNSESFKSMRIFSDVSSDIDDDCIEFLLSNNPAYTELGNAYDELIQYLDLLGEELQKISMGISKPEWTAKDVLVGALRNRKQLNVCLNHKFYHVPVDSLSLINITVNYIAIYQSKKLFGDFAGIKYWGRVVKCELVERSEIKEIPSDSSKKYYKFTVENWHMLYPPVESAGNGTVFGFTNLFLLLNAQSVNELYFAEKDEFMLYNAIRNGIFENLDNVAYRYKDTILTLKDDMLNIFRNGKLIFTVNQNEYIKNIGGNFLKIKKLY